MVQVPAAVAGHSLGEYTALVAAGALQWTDALRLVRRRGELMSEIGQRSAGGMVAVLGLPADDVEWLCAEAARTSGAVVEVANRNTQRQTVISGEPAALTEASAAARAAGGHAVPLRVSAPFHCSLMRDVAATFEESLREVALRHPEVPVLANTTAAPARGPEEIRLRLAEQVCGAVRWVDTLRSLAAAGITAVVEVGPGEVLTGLAREVLPAVPGRAPAPTPTG